MPQPTFGTVNDPSFVTSLIDEDAVGVDRDRASAVAIRRIRVDVWRFMVALALGENNETEMNSPSTAVR